MFTQRRPRSNFFFFNDTATTEIYTLSLHDALPICSSTVAYGPARQLRNLVNTGGTSGASTPDSAACTKFRDRKSTRLNSSHSQISYAVFCLKKKTKYICHVTVSSLSSTNTYTEH